MRVDPAGCARRRVSACICGVNVKAGEAGVNGFAKEIIVHSNPTFPAPA